MNLRLSAKGIVVLAYTLFPLTIGMFLRIPALGFLFGFALTPLVHLITFRELYLTQFIYQSIFTLRQIADSPIILGILGIFLPKALTTWSLFYPLYYVFLIGMIPLTTLIQCFAFRFAYFLLPKRLKIERIGY